MTSNRPPSIRPTARDHSAPNDPDDLDEKPPGLSVTQVVASALAAVSSTVLLSYLGVAGTIIGAGVASVLTVVGNNLYTRSILKTRRQMKAAMKAGVVLPVGKNGRKVLLPTLAGSASGSDHGDRGDTGEAGASTSVLPTVGDTARVTDTAVLSAEDVGGTRLDEVRTAATDGPDGATDVPDGSGASGGAVDGDGTDGDGGDATDGEDATSRRPSRKTLILSAVGVFLVLIVGVTLVEVVAGRPLSEILRGEEGSGTSISHVVSREPATTGDTGDTTVDTTTDSPSTGTTPSPDPSEVPTPAPTDPPTTVPDPEPTTPVTPEPNPTPGTGGDSGGTGGTGGSGAGSGSGSGGTDLEQLPGTGAGSGSGAGAEGVPGTGASGSATS